MGTRLAALGGASLLIGGTSLWSALDGSSSPAHVRDFDASVAVKTEEYARYPCEQLHGYDVVVKNYYVPAESVSGAESGIRSRFSHWWQQVFSDGPAKRQLAPTSAAMAASLSHHGNVRLLVRENDEDSDGEGGLTEGRGSSPEAHTHTTATTADSPPLCSSSTWPRGTLKYSSLVLEPSRDEDCGGLLSNSPSSSSSSSSSLLLSSSSRGFLRQWTDAATDQTVVRCDPLSRDVDFNCSNRGTTLEAPYLRAMMSVLSWLPARPAPLHVGILGVGGGALPAFLQRYCGRILERMDLVDVEPMCFRAALEDLGMERAVEVVAPSYSHSAAISPGPLGDGGAGESSNAARADGVHLFAMNAMEFLRQRVSGSSGSGLLLAPPPPPPPPPRRYTGGSPLVKHCSAPVFSESVSTTAETAPPATRVKWQTSVPGSRHRHNPPPFDVLFVDLYAGSALSEEVTQDAFLKLCRANLSSHGVVAFNLPQRVKSFEKQCELAFGGPSQVYAFPVPSAANYIVVACKGKGTAISHRLLCRRAEEATRTFHLPFSLQKQFPIAWRYW